MEQVKEAVQVQIHWMVRRHLPELLQIEQLSYDQAWGEEDFLRCLRTRDVIGMVAERGTAIVGFMLYELHKHHIYLINFAVHPSFRRCQVGTQLATRLQNKLSPVRRSHIITHVPDGNLPGQLFFKSVGFRCTRVDKGFFPDPAGDAYRFRYDLAGPVAFGAEPVNRILPFDQD